MHSKMLQWEIPIFIATWLISLRQRVKQLLSEIPTDKMTMSLLTRIAHKIKQYIRVRENKMYSKSELAAMPLIENSQSIQISIH